MLLFKYFLAIALSFNFLNFKIKREVITKQYHHDTNQQFRNTSILRPECLDFVAGVFCREYGVNTTNGQVVLTTHHGCCMVYMWPVVGACCKFARSLGSLVGIRP